MRVRACVHMCACGCACVRARLRVCVCVRAHARVCVYVRMFVFVAKIQVIWTLIQLTVGGVTFWWDICSDESQRRDILVRR